MVQAAVTDIDGYVVDSEQQYVPGNSTIDAMLNADMRALFSKNYYFPVMSKVVVKREIAKIEETNAGASPVAGVSHLLQGTM